MGILYTDGACSGNPGPGGWAFLLVVGDRVTEKGGFEDRTTNNRMELIALMEALSLIQSEGLALYREPTEAHIDSKYVLEGVTKWRHGWRNRGWTTSTGEPVANLDLWKQIDVQLDAMLKDGFRFSWKHVRGHSGDPGNERVDFLAVSQSRKEKTDFYQGPLGLYPHLKKGEHSFPLYLAKIGDKILRFKTWPECEAEVKGRSGARFKKVTNAGEEAQALALWEQTKKP